MRQTLQRALLVILQAAIMFAQAGCLSAGQDKIEGSYQGKNYVLLPAEGKDAAGASWQLKLADLPAVVINPATTSWGPSYSGEVLGNNGCTDTSNTKYSNEAYAQNKGFVAPGILFVASSSMSKEQFETYCHFITAEWPKISAAATAKGINNLPDIIGLAYGTREDFAQDFYGNYQGKKITLRVEADGRIRLMDEDQTTDDNVSGLSVKVQMPGKKIWFDTAAMQGKFSITDLDSFKNKAQQPLTEVFSVEAGRELVNDQQEIESKISFKWHAVYIEQKGKRQELEDNADDVFLWFKGDGSLEDVAHNAVKLGTWRYDASTGLLSTVRNGVESTNGIRSITDKELVLEARNQAGATINVGYRRIK